MSPHSSKIVGRLSVPDFKSVSDVADTLGVSSSTLSYYAFVLPFAAKYNSFKLSTKQGKTRTISAPIPPLKKIQKQLSAEIRDGYCPRPHVHGYVEGRSPISNAEVHKNQRWVLHVDIADFFPSITIRRIRGVFSAFPFDYCNSVAKLLAVLCCGNGVLPQGAPTSPLLSNLICRSLDKNLAQLAWDKRCRYSRYCDDMVFSTNMRSFPKELAFTNEFDGSIEAGPDVNSKIEREGFRLRREKTNLNQNTERQMVTGLTVNKFVNIPKHYLRSLRNILYIWGAYGLEDAQASFEKHFQRNRPAGKDMPTFEQIVRGRIQYVGSVKGWYDPVYRRLADNLAKVDPTFSPTKKPSNRPITMIFVHCEGKTDIKHLASAWRVFGNDYPQLELWFTHASNDSELLKRIVSLSSMYQNVPSVGLFDSDAKKVVTQVSGGADGFKKWSRGVYTCVLPSPPHRGDNDPLCIELLHFDCTLKKVDAVGRRIYRKSEFQDNGFHLDGHAVKVKGGTSLIVGEVRDVVTQKNIALSKDSFAEQIVRKKAPFDNVDMSGFKCVFEKLTAIREQWLEDRLEPF